MKENKLQRQYINKKNYILTYQKFGTQFGFLKFSLKSDLLMFPLVNINIYMLTNLHILVAIVICEAIKQNESEVGQIQF